jgi:hypothetical protein
MVKTLQHKASSPKSYNRSPPSPSPVIQSEAKDISKAKNLNTTHVTNQQQILISYRTSKEILRHISAAMC